MSTVHPAAVSTGAVVAAAPFGILIGLALGALGGGGSILAVPALVYGVGETAHTATATSLVTVGATALVGMVGHLRTGSVRLFSGLTFGLAGLGGSLLGSLLSRAVPNDVLLLSFSALILVAAWRMRARQAETPCHTRQLATVAADGARDQSASVRDASPATKSAGNVSGHRRTVTATAWRVLIAGSVVGFLTGFFGVGGGFVIVPALVLALDYEMPVAVGTSLLVIAISSAEGVLFRLSSGGIEWGVAIPFTAGGIVGVLLGDMIASRVPAARLTRWFVWLLVAVACYTAAQSILSM
ncbi:sulfite exporter TauE/SafE family protein [Mycobacterium kansasii]|uniref:sulfite exporter TauE/SafE family protein n=2 Tax=Mycobacterium kansasii TaxID=1768 RepID=UPI001C675492|nr:sulfite exporter TauE/SafE family protein [Mycobacterium kansasii]